MGCIKKIVLLMWNCFGTIFPITGTKILYKSHFGRKLDLNNPQCLTEKLQWLKLYRYSNNESISNCIDKYEVRKYVEKKGLGHLLNNLLFVWESVEEIKWDTLPESYVLKCSHGCGYNIIVRKGSDIDVSQTTKQLKRWMGERYGKDGVELLYDHIKPHIICEEYIKDLDDNIRDYKFFCNYGEVKFVYVTSYSEDSSSEQYIDYYTPEWKHIPVKSGKHKNSPNEVLVPKGLEEMKKYAEILSKEFPICRVDLYNVDGRIIFGELTFLPSGGLCDYTPAEYDLKFGQEFNI